MVQKMCSAERYGVDLPDDCGENGLVTYDIVKTSPVPSLTLPSISYYTKK
jgi:hypothetical protein